MPSLRNKGDKGKGRSDAAKEKLTMGKRKSSSEKADVRANLSQELEGAEGTKPESWKSVQQSPSEAQ